MRKIMLVLVVCSDFPCDIFFMQECHQNQHNLHHINSPTPNGLSTRAQTNRNFHQGVHLQSQWRKMVLILPKFPQLSTSGVFPDEDLQCDGNKPVGSSTKHVPGIHKGVHIGLIQQSSFCRYFIWKKQTTEARISSPLVQTTTDCDDDKQQNSKLVRLKI